MENGKGYGRNWSQPVLSIFPKGLWRTTNTQSGWPVSRPRTECRTPPQHEGVQITMPGCL